MTETVADRIRARLKDEMTRQRITQRDVAGLLAWPQSRVSKILNGRIGLDVDDVAALCFAMNLSLVEAVRDPGLEFCADMTPTELRLLKHIRQLPRHAFDAVTTMIHFQVTTAKPERHATKLAQPIKKVRYSRT